MKEMTSLQRCMAVLNGDIPDMLPVIPQSFMFAVETAGMKIGPANQAWFPPVRLDLYSDKDRAKDGNHSLSVNRRSEKSKNQYPDGN